MNLFFIDNIDVVYTLWSNLKKTPGMEVGQVGFYKEKEVDLFLLIYITSLFFFCYLTDVSIVLG